MFLQGKVNEAYLLLVIVLACGIPTVDRITIIGREVLIERFYIYTIFKKHWAANEGCNYHFKLYSRQVNDTLPETDNSLIDFFTLITPFRYKSQGLIIENKRAKQWQQRMYFGLYEVEYKLLSQILTDHPQTPSHAIGKTDRQFW